MILHKVEIKLIQKTEVDCGCGDTCAGYFDDAPKPVFVCAIGGPQRDWVPTFIHEFCHFIQWKDQTKEWLRYQKIDTECLLDKWIGDEIELPLETVKKLVRATRDIELDCEKRVVDVISRFDLEFDVEDYTKKANAYILYFNLIPHYRGWFQKESPSEVNQIMKIMPGKFLKNYNRTPKKFAALVDKYCF